MDYIPEGVYLRNTTEMTYQHAPNTYLNWDFETVWFIYPAVNDGYPVLEEFELESEGIYFLEAPVIKTGDIRANVVTVKSPSASYTATQKNLSKDDYIERVLDIDEGDINVCRIIAEKLLELWGRPTKNLTGEIQLRQNLHFKQKVVIIIPGDNFRERMQVQKISHDIIAQKTGVTCGDIILSDNELLARIIEERKKKVNL